MIGNQTTTTTNQLVTFWSTFRSNESSAAGDNSYTTTTTSNNTIATPTTTTTTASSSTTTTNGLDSRQRFDSIEDDCIGTTATSSIGTGQWASFFHSATSPSGNQLDSGDVRRRRKLHQQQQQQQQRNDNKRMHHRKRRQLSIRRALTLPNIIATEQQWANGNFITLIPSKTNPFEPTNYQQTIYPANPLRATKLHKGK